MPTKMCECRNCGRFKADAGRKLCFVCRKKPGVLERFARLGNQRGKLGNEMPRCMACGEPSPSGNHVQAAGWFSRDTGCGVDVQCPPCMGRWGWPPLRPYKYPGDDGDEEEKQRENRDRGPRIYKNWVKRR